MSIRPPAPPSVRWGAVAGGATSLGSVPQHRHVHLRCRRQLRCEVQLPRRGGDVDLRRCSRRRRQSRRPRGYRRTAYAGPGATHGTLDVDQPVAAPADSALPAGSAATAAAGLRPRLRRRPDDPRLRQGCPDRDAGGDDDHQRDGQRPRAARSPLARRLAPARRRSTFVSRARRRLDQPPSVTPSICTPRRAARWRAMSRPPNHPGHFERSAGETADSIRAALIADLSGAYAIPAAEAIARLGWTSEIRPDHRLLVVGRREADDEVPVAGLDERAPEIRRGALASRSAAPPAACPPTSRRRRCGRRCRPARAPPRRSNRGSGPGRRSASARSRLGSRPTSSQCRTQRRLLAPESLEADRAPLMLFASP